MNDPNYGSYSERRPITPFGLMFRHPIALLLCILLFAGAGAALGLTRTPVYTSESRVSVTKLDVQTQALPGYALAAQSLASAYAREAEATTVQRCAERRTGEKLLNESALTGSPLPRSPVIRVIAKATTSRGAIRLANRGAGCLVKDVTARAAPDLSEQYLKEYATASQEVDTLSNRLSDLKEENPDPTAAQRKRQSRLQSQIDVQRLIKNSVAQQYSSAASGQQQVANVSVLTRAAKSSSDEREKLAISTFSGGVVGLLVGLALAAMLETRRARRLERATAKRG